MVLLRLVVLLILVVYGYVAGVGSNAPGSAADRIIFYVALAGLYLLPSYEANRRKHPRLLPIALIDVLLGWTLVGWLVAYVWALRMPEPQVEDVENVDSPYTVVEEPASRYPANSTADALRELARLHEEGAINDEEFAAAKARVVAPR
ncbi:superinfection immunity protein [Xylophilus sp. Kf1]|nr:superinfection immunity protein [Xylophilus sp. Kf1]